MPRKILTGLIAVVLMVTMVMPAMAANRFVFRQKELTISEGETVAMTVERDGTYAGDGEVVFSSGRPNVATVDADGNVTGVNKGQTTITATLMRNGKKAGQTQCTV